MMIEVARDHGQHYSQRKHVRGGRGHNDPLRRVRQRRLCPLAMQPPRPAAFQGPAASRARLPRTNVPHKRAAARGRTRPRQQPSIVNRQSGCGLCVVELAGQPELLRACCTPVAEGMSIQTESETLRQLRRTSLMPILARHPHACLTCAQREGCSLEDCSSNVPKDERCCDQFHNCELRKVVEYVGVKEQTPATARRVCRLSPTSRCLHAISICASTVRVVCGSATRCAASEPWGSSTTASASLWAASLRP